jgi:polysaccharide export outer membrane protein
VDEASGKVEAAAEAVLRNPVVVSMVLFPAVRSTLDDMSGSYTIRPDGKITVPRLGELQAAGYSTPELQRELAMLAGGVVHNPVKPSVGVAQATGARIYVGGEVALPGVYPLQGAPSALQAILMARGATDRARLDSVLVIRRNPTGKPFVFKTNLAEALDGRTENDLMLRSFDVVYVPMKPISKANLFVQQYIDDIVPFDNSLGVTGTYYLNEQETRTKSRNVNFSTGVSVVPGVGLVP